jgi:NAD(P)-dependent dehydrogenase (short-subunit alcohol dehydrogenase family)
VAIVTGGSSGFGRATCLALAQAGAHVVAVGRNAERLAETVALLVAQRPAQEQHQTRALALSLDVQSEADVERMAERTLEEFGRIDILVCSAGIVRPPGSRLRMVAQMPVSDFDPVIATNLRGVFLCNRAVLPAMIRQGNGNIVNVSSTSGLAGIGFDGPYCASKFGVQGLSEVLADEVAPLGIRVQVLSPGPFETEMWTRSGNQLRPGGMTNPPPAARVANMILYLLALPMDTRLVSPLVQPTALEVGRSLLQGVGASNPQRASPASNRQETTKEPTMSPSQAQTTPRLEGKVVIVTGGTGGIGWAICRAVAGEGATVVVADVNQDRIDAAVRDLPPPTNARAGHLGVVVDVRRESDAQNLAQATLERFGRIDALVASAGILRKRGTPPKPLVQTTTEEWDEVLDINLKGVFLTNRAVLPTMIQQRSGMILNISSVSGLKGRAHDGPYCASKFGVIGLSQSIADEVRSYGVKVQALMPDSIATPIWEQNYPVPPPGDALPPERVADLILFMLTQAEDTILVGPVIAPLGARRRKSTAKTAGKEGATPPS